MQAKCFVYIVTMTKFKQIILPCFALLLIAATPTVQKLDPLKSEIAFELSGGPLEVFGELKNYQGQIRLDHKDFTRSEISFTVPLTDFSLKTKKTILSSHLPHYLKS